MHFHLHPSVKATRLTDGHGVLLMMPNKEAWTFSAGDNDVQLEDSVYLAGNGDRAAPCKWSSRPRRTAPRVVWSFQQANAGALATAGTARRAARRRTEAAAVNPFSPLPPGRRIDRKNP